MVLDKIAPGIITIAPDAPLGEALDAMYTREIHHLLVVEGGRVRGIVSDRDILGKALDREAMQLNMTLKVRDIMTRDTPILGEGTSFGDALAAMQDRKLSALAIRRDNGVGIVTETDFLRIARQLLGREERRSLGEQLDVELANPLVQSVMKLLSDIGI